MNRIWAFLINFGGLSIFVFMAASAWPQSSCAEDLRSTGLEGNWKSFDADGENIRFEFPNTITLLWRFLDVNDNPENCEAKVVTKVYSIRSLLETDGWTTIEITAEVRQSTLAKGTPSLCIPSDSSIGEVVGAVLPLKFRVLNKNRIYRLFSNGHIEWFGRER